MRSFLAHRRSVHARGSNTAHRGADGGADAADAAGGEPAPPDVFGTVATGADPAATVSTPLELDGAAPAPTEVFEPGHAESPHGRADSADRLEAASAEVGVDAPIDRLVEGDGAARSNEEPAPVAPHNEEEPEMTEPTTVWPSASSRHDETPDRTTRLKLYRSMVALRGFEKRAYDLFLQGLVKGTSHLGLGQEAIAAAFGVAMAPGDYTFATYRGHNHTLARGVPMTPVMGELMGRECGLMAGKGGSMHLTSVEHGMMGCYAIIGAHLTIANGAALSAKHRGSGQVAVCFFGDGTTNIGAFHEALNLAATWKLPVVFVCENNLWMEYTPIASVTAVTQPAADRASAYGLAPILVDGNDADVMYSTATAAIARARAGEGPSLIEALTYRHGGHSRADPAKYRAEDEVAYWLEKDPIPNYRARLLDHGVDAALLESIEATVAAEIEQMTIEATTSPPPSPDLVLSDVFADGGSSWRN